MAALEEAFAFTRLVGVVGDRSPTRTPTGMLEVLEPVLDHVVVTRTTSPRAMRPDALGELAAEIFGEDRVTVVRDLPDALDAGRWRWPSRGRWAAACIATGSVMTAAEVRMLLGVVEP